MTHEIIERADTVIANTYQRFPILLTRGRGCQLWDAEGRSYTDFIAGIAVCNLGHAHPRVVKALAGQAETLWHVSNLYYTAPQVELAAWLVGHSFADRLFFCNSGAEANEAAIKLVRRYFSEKGQSERYRIIAMEQSFHGRTMAALSATGQEKIKHGFQPVLAGFEFVPFNNLDALKQKMGSTVAAVLLEPIQGEGGVCCPQPDYLQGVRQMCDDTGTLLIFDEIQTGIGRTGKLFAYEHYGVEPDIMTLAKALANGLPIGAMLATETVATAFGPGAHGSTFGGTPLVATAALEVLKVLDEEQIIARSRETGGYFKQKLLALKDRHAAIEEVRGVGLLLGLKLAGEGEPAVRACLERGLLINCIQGSVLRFAPPLTISTAEIDTLIAALDEILEEYHG